MKLSKSQLRQRMQALLQDIPHKAQKSQQICQQLLHWIHHHSSQACNIAVYLAKNPEVNIDAAIATLLDGPHTLYSPCYQDKTWQLSRLVSLKDTRSSHFGIREALDSSEKINAEQIHIWLVPGLAFDKTGKRLGYGKGIYDRWLQQSSAAKAGICYSDQMIDSIPTENWDQSMDWLINEQNLIRAR